MADAPKALQLLREHQAQLLAILEASTAGSSLAQVLRTALDPRPLPARIDWSVRFACANLVREEFDRPKLVARARAKLEEYWPQLPLVEMPCDKPIGRVLERMHAEKLAAFPGEIPHATQSTTYASTVAST